MSERKLTVDGVPVKLGDRVWYWIGYGSPRLRKLNAAIADERRELKKAKQTARTAKQAIERLTRRRKEIDAPEPTERSPPS